MFCQELPSSISVMLFTVWLNVTQKIVQFLPLKVLPSRVLGRSSKVLAVDMGDLWECDVIPLDTQFSVVFRTMLWSVFLVLCYLCPSLAQNSEFLSEYMVTELLHTFRKWVSTAFRAIPQVTRVNILSHQLGFLFIWIYMIKCGIVWNSQMLWTWTKKRIFSSSTCVSPDISLNIFWTIRPHPMLLV